MNVLKLAGRAFPTLLILALTGCWWDAKSPDPPTSQSLAPTIQVPVQPSSPAPVPQSVQQKCEGGDASSCMVYSAALNKACSQISQKTVGETLDCDLNTQCYQDKGLAIQQFNASCGGQNPTTPACTLTKQKVDAPCAERDPRWVGVLMSAAQIQAYQQAILGPGHSVAVNWMPINSPNANPVSYPQLGFLGGSDDDAFNYAFDKYVNRPEHVCVVGILDGGQQVEVPGKWISDHCNAVWKNMYVVADNFTAAIRYPNGSHGHWGLIGEGLKSNQLFIHPIPDPPLNIDLGTSLEPCMAHYSWQKDGLDRLVSALTGDSLDVDTGDQLGYLVGNSCRFEFNSQQVNSSDNVRVYYLTYRPPPPVPVKIPTTPPKGVQNPQGTQWTVVNHRSATLQVYAFLHDTIPGYNLDCRNESPVMNLAPNGVWPVWVPIGKTLDVRFYEDTQGNGGCSANFVVNPALDGRSGQASAREDIN